MTEAEKNTTNRLKAWTLWSQSHSPHCFLFKRSLAHRVKHHPANQFTKEPRKWLEWGTAVRPRKNLNHQQQMWVTKENSSTSGKKNSHGWYFRKKTTAWPAAFAFKHQRLQGNHSLFLAQIPVKRKQFVPSWGLTLQSSRIKIMWISLERGGVIKEARQKWLKLECNLLQITKSGDMMANRSELYGPQWRLWTQVRMSAHSFSSWNLKQETTLSKRMRVWHSESYSTVIYLLNKPCCKKPLVQSGLSDLDTV